MSLVHMMPVSSGVLVGVQSELSKLCTWIDRVLLEVILLGKGLSRGLENA